MFIAGFTIISALACVGCTRHPFGDSTANVEPLEPEAVLDAPEPECAADVTSDPRNCGTCGVVCTSALCYSGVCADAIAGHVFAIGHGYEISNGALDKLLGNAVFLNDRSTIRVLAYAGTAPATLLSGTNSAIEREAIARGRTWSLTTITNSADVAIRIADADVFLVYPQPTADSLYLYYLGDEWSLRLDNFTRGGGVVIVLDTQSDNAGTAQILIRPGFMTLSGRTPASGHGHLSDHEDVAAARLPTMFALSNSVVWAPSERWRNVVADDAGGVLVVHRAIY